MTLYDTRNFLRAVSLSLATAAIVACGSGGDGGNNPPPSGGNPPPTTGTVAVLLRDNPTEHFAQILAYVDRIDLLGADGPTNLFMSGEPEGTVVDLLDLQNQSEVFAVATDVPVGEYEKIRMTLKDLALVPHGAEEDEIQWEHPKLPGNGKMDLNPRGSIQVIGGETLLVDIDMDMNKSLHVHQTGNGKWQFRPVIFVTVMPDSDRLVRIYGEVRDYQGAQSPFELCPVDPMAPADDGGDMSEDDDTGRCLDVFLHGEGDFGAIRVFDESGLEGTFDNGSMLTAIGFLRLHDDDDDDDSREDDLRLDALVLHVGSPEAFERLAGSVATQRRSDGIFGFDTTPADSEPVLIDVQYQGGPILDLSANREVAPDVILPGAMLEVNGVTADPAFLATLMLLGEAGMAPEVSLIGGTITDILVDTRAIDVTVEADPVTCVKTTDGTRYLEIEIDESETSSMTTELTADQFFDPDPEVGAEVGDVADVFGSNEIVDEAPTGCIIADTIQTYVPAPAP